MEQAQQFINLARQAAEENAHVAAAMYLRTAAELSGSKAELATILETAMKQACSLKKPTDEIAMYIWGYQIAKARDMPDDFLETLVKTDLSRPNLPRTQPFEFHPYRNM